MKRDEIGNCLVATALGFTLSSTGFSSYDEVQRMFGFVSLRLFGTFLLTVVILFVSWKIIAARTSSPPTWTPKPIHRGTLVGGVLFGMGWTICGACPSIALVQIGEGQGLALLSLLGIFLGNWIYSMVHERYLRFDTGSCATD